MAGVARQPKPGSEDSGGIDSVASRAVAGSGAAHRSPTPQLGPSVDPPAEPDSDSSSPEQQSEEQQTRLRNWLWLAVNAAASVSLVLVNKQIFRAVPQRSFIIFLTLVHQICNLIYVHVMAALGLKDLNSGPSPSRADALACALGFASYITLSNSSLSTNSVAFYQTAKVMEIPLMFVGQFIVLNIRKGYKVVSALLLVITGLVVAAGTDVQLTVHSMMFAFAASVADCYYTVMAARARRGGVSADALMRAMAPACILLLLFAIALQASFAQYSRESLQREMAWTHPSAAIALLVLLSCGLAVLLNLSFFVVLGYFEPVTLSMFREVKTIMVVVSGFVISGAFPPWLNLFGIMVALSGAFAYSQVNR